LPLVSNTARENEVDKDEEEEEESEEDIYRKRKILQGCSEIFLKKKTN
jgi:hypothetical protein